ncbi:hypothetical protein RFI_25009, partial [Reticulomyxa filosa]
HYHIFIPRYPILSVVDGAARVGKISNFVKSRIVNKTYGVSCAIHMVEAIDSGVSADHIQNHKFTTSDGQEFVNSCFDVFVQKGEEIKVDQIVEHEFGSSKGEWWDSSFDYVDTTTIYSSDEKNPLVVSGLKPLATLHVRLPRELQSNKFKVSNRFYFGNTTLRVTTLITTADGKCIEKEVSLDYDYSIEKPTDANIWLIFKKHFSYFLSRQIVAAFDILKNFEFFHKECHSKNQKNKFKNTFFKKKKAVNLFWFDSLLIK